MNELEFAIAPEGVSLKNVYVFIDNADFRSYIVISFDETITDDVCVALLLKNRKWNTLNTTEEMALEKENLVAQFSESETNTLHHCRQPSLVADDAIFNGRARLNFES